MFYDGVGGVENVAGGAVVLFKADGKGVLILALEGENVFDCSPSKAINTLVVVSNHAYVSVGA